MNFKSVSLAVFSLFGLIAAEQSEQQHRRDNSAVCTKELEEIVYQPESATLAYFTRISEGFKCAGPVLWTPQNISFIQTFENKYNVNVEVFDAFGHLIYPEIIPALKNTLTKDDRLNMGSITATANMNGSGYVRDTDAEEMAKYEFIVYDYQGRLKYVQINMPLSEAPSFKN